jgi:hypothetical protein
LHVQLRRAALCTLALILVAGALVAGAQPAAASTITTSTPVRACTNLADASCAAWTTLPAGSTVTMRCWRDQSSYAGTVRWFWVDGPGRQGFVSANHVRSQTSVPHCNTKPSVQAVRWAGTKLKENIYQYRCLAFVHDAWKYAGREIGSRATAQAFWNSPPSGTRVATSSTAAPVGALVFWRSGTDGHVAISIGDGYVISTLERTFTAVHVFKIADRNAARPGTYLGWIQY